MSHFTVLTVVTQDRLENSVDDILDEHQPILDSGDPSVMGEENRDFGEALLEVHENEDDDIREALTETALHNAIADLLAPYQENNMGTCPEEYLEFWEGTSEIEQDVKEVVEEGDFLAKDHPEYVGRTVGELFLDQLKNDSEAKEKAINRGFPEEKLDEATELDAVALLYQGYSAHDIDGEYKYGYYEKPNAKWDWYQVGGRWSGELKVDEEGKGFRGSTGLMGPTPPDDRTAVDIAQVGDLDIRGYRKQTDEKIEEFWNKYQIFIETGEEPGDLPPYGVHHDLMQMGIEWTNKDEVREAQNHNRQIKEAQESLRYLDMSEEEVEKVSMFSQRYAQKVRSQYDAGEISREELEETANRDQVEEPEAIYGKQLTRDELKNQYRWYFEWSTYAALDDEGWHSKGEMGWFGCSSDESDDREDWGRSFFEKFLLSQEEDTYVAVVDCHI